MSVVNPMISNVKIRIMDDTSAVCEWHADGYRYFFWFDHRKKLLPATSYVQRKRTDVKRSALSRAVRVTARRCKPMMDAVYAYVETEQLLPKALEVERIAKEQERARWREQRRTEIINKFGVEMYAALKDKPPYPVVHNLLVKIDEAIIKFDLEQL